MSKESAAEALGWAYPFGCWGVRTRSQGRVTTRSVPKTLALFSYTPHVYWENLSVDELDRFSDPKVGDRVALERRIAWGWESDGEVWTIYRVGKSFIAIENSVHGKWHTFFRRKDGYTVAALKRLWRVSPIKADRE